MPDHLSPSDLEKLDQFQVITSFKDEDYDKVVTLLKNNYWNLEVSISKYFDGELDNEQTPTLPNNQIPQNNNDNNDNNNNNNDLNQFQVPTDLFDNRPLENLQNYSNIGLIPSLIRVSPITNRWKSEPGLIKPSSGTLNVSNILSSFTESPILFLLLIIPRTITFLLLKIGNIFEYLFPTSPNTIPLQPSLSNFEIESYFTLKVKDSFNLNISKLEYNETLKHCIDENKLFLLILIKDDDDITSSNFLKKILNNDSIIEFINNEVNSDNLITYIGSVNELQSFEIAKSLKIRTLPVVYLIGNVGSGSSINKSLSILAKIPIKTVNLFKSRLIREIERFKPELILRKFEQNELNYSRQIKKLQDDAFSESLKKDQLKKEQQEKQQREKIELENILKRKEFNRKTFLINTYNEYHNQDRIKNFDLLDKKEITTIRIKIPNGDSIMEKFTNKDTLYQLYSIIQLKIHLNSLTEEEKENFINLTKEETENKIDDDFEFDFKFELISPFPRFIVPVESNKLIKDVNQLWPNGSILVEFNDDDEDDDNDEDDE